MNVDGSQAISLLGASLVLAGYGGQQYAGMRPESLSYGLLNLIGSSLLAATAIVPLNAGVLLLESVWALMSVRIVYRSLAGKMTRSDPPAGPESRPLDEK